MAKAPYNPGRSRPRPPGPIPRPESGIDDERPFAEIRKALYDALRLLSIHRWAFFVPFCVVSCAAFILSLYYPRTYRATTSFERKNDPVMMNLPMSAGAASFKYFRNTMVRDLTSVENMLEVVDHLGLTKNFERDEHGALTSKGKRKRLALARSLAGTLSITTTSPSEYMDIITVTYTGPDPHIGRKLVDEVKRTYIRRTMAWIHDFLTSQRDYFQKEAEKALARVKQYQREETRLRLQNPHADPVNPASIALRLSQLNMERRELLRRKREYESELAALKQRLAAIAPPLPAASTRKEDDNASQATRLVLDEETLALREELRTLEGKIRTLKEERGMTDLHPEVIKLTQRKDRIAAYLMEKMQSAPSVRAKVAVDDVGPPLPAEPGGSFTSIEHSQLLAQISAQESKIKDVVISLETTEAAIDELEKAKREVFQKQEEFAEVTARVARAKQEYQQLEGTLATIEPAISAIEQDRLLQFSEGQPARGSSIPVSPSAKTVVLLALLAGIATGVVFVILAEIFDHVFRSSSQVARTLGLPLLESIDEIVTAETRRTQFIRHAVLNPLIIGCFLLLLALTGSMAYLSIERPWTYEKLRAIPEAAIRLFAGNTDGILPEADVTGLY